jgi:hypothetical protein
MVIATWMLVSRTCHAGKRLSRNGQCDVATEEIEKASPIVFHARSRSGAPLVGPDGKEITDDQIFVDLDALAASSKKTGDDDDGYDSQDEDLRFRTGVFRCFPL